MAAESVSTASASSRTSTPAAAGSAEVQARSLDVENAKYSTSGVDVVETQSVHPAHPPPTATPGHRALPSGDSSLFDAQTATSGYVSKSDLDVPVGEAGGKRGVAYLCIPGDDEGKGRKPRKKLRLFVACRDLSETSPSGGVIRSKYAYAVVYFRDTQLVSLGKDLCLESAVTEETKESRSRATSRSYSVEHGARGAMQGRTERARVCGREVEFARHFILPYLAARVPVVHIDVYGADATDGQKVRLIGTASCKLESLYTRRGYAVSLNLRPPPPDAPNETTARRKKKPPTTAGTLQVAVEDVTAGASTYFLDVQCACIRRARPWGAARVRRAFYTLHAVATSDSRCDDWVLLYRSPAVESVRRKRDGGSMEYNYFSSRPLLATPGVVIPEKEDSGNVSGLRARLRRRDDSSFFSMPSGRFMVPTPGRRMKLTVWEATAAFSGPEVVAATELSVDTLRSMQLGERLDMRIHASVVGHATLKFVEKSELQSPGYFCLSVSLPDMLP